MTQRHILTGAGGSLADLIMAMAADAAKQNDDQSARFNIENGYHVPSNEIPHQVQPDYVDSDKDFDAKGFEDFMTHLFGDYRDQPSDYYADQHVGYNPNFVLVDNDDLFDSPDEGETTDVFTSYDDQQQGVSVYIENINVSIVIERD